MSDELRRKILARRARFVTAAIASAGLAACRPCLDVAPPDDGVRPDAPTAKDAGPTDGGAEPVPCLDVPPPDTGVPLDMGLPPDTGVADAGAKETGPAPRPCLKVASPKACLDY